MSRLAKNLAGGLFVAFVFWLPVIVHLWQQKP